MRLKRVKKLLTAADLKHWRCERFHPVCDAFKVEFGPRERRNSTRLLRLTQVKPNTAAGLFVGSAAFQVLIKLPCIILCFCAAG